MLAVEGVRAANRNDWDGAYTDFLRAYSLDPYSAFSLNNRAFAAEHEGDLESAQFFYEKARKAFNANAPVGTATRLSAQGMSLSAVAGDSNAKVESALDEYSRQRRRETAPVELTPRGSGPAAPQAPRETPDNIQ